MSDDVRKKQIIDIWAAAWDRGEVDALDGLLGPDYRRRSFPGDEGQSREEFKSSILATRSAFPALATTVDEIVADGDRVAVRWHSRGRHEGPFNGVPATHRTVDVDGATFARFEDGLIVEEFVTWDPRALLTALGIITVGEDR